MDNPYLFVGSRFLHRDCIRAGRRTSTGAVELTLDLFDEGKLDADGRPLGIADRVTVPAGEAAETIWRILQGMGTVIVNRGERGVP